MSSWSAICLSTQNCKKRGREVSFRLPASPYTTCLVLAFMGTVAILLALNPSNAPGLLHDGGLVRVPAYLETWWDSEPVTLCPLRRVSILQADARGR